MMNHQAEDPTAETLKRIAEALEKIAKLMEINYIQGSPAISSVSGRRAYVHNPNNPDPNRNDY